MHLDVCIDCKTTPPPQLILSAHLVTNFIFYKFLLWEPQIESSCTGWLTSMTPHSSVTLTSVTPGDVTPEVWHLKNDGWRRMAHFCDTWWCHCQVSSFKEMLSATQLVAVLIRQGWTDNFLSLKRGSGKGFMEESGNVVKEQRERRERGKEATGGVGVSQERRVEIRRRLQDCVHFSASSTRGARERVSSSLHARVAFIFYFVACSLC